MNRSRWHLVAVVFLSMWVAGSLNAGPIVYSGQLFHGVPVIGSNSQPNWSPDDPVGAQYYFLYATAGALVEVIGDRLIGDYDMAFWILSGRFSDTDEFGGDFGTHPAAIVFGDDEDPPNLPGPYGDPHKFFTAPVTGFYTVAVTNWLSSGEPPYAFQLQANFVPEPSTWTLIGLTAVVGVAVRLRRRKK